MFPMLVRDVLLTLAAHEFFSPKWSPRIRDEWTRNLVARMADRDGEDVARNKVARIAAAVEAAFPDALVATEHLSESLQIEVIHPDDFVMDLVDLNEKRAVAAFRELRARKKNPPMSIAELIQRLRDGGLVQASLWLSSSDVVALL